MRLKTLLGHPWLILSVFYLIIFLHTTQKKIKDHVRLEPLQKLRVILRLQPMRLNPAYIVKFQEETSFFSNKLVCSPIFECLKNTKKLQVLMRHNQHTCLFSLVNMKVNEQSQVHRLNPATIIKLTNLGVQKKQLSNERCSMSKRKNQILA